MLFVICLYLTAEEKRRASEEKVFDAISEAISKLISTNERISIIYFNLNCLRL